VKWVLFSLCAKPTGMFSSYPASFTTLFNVYLSFSLTGFSVRGGLFVSPKKLFFVVLKPVSSISLFVVRVAYGPSFPPHRRPIFLVLPAHAAADFAIRRQEPALAFFLAERRLLPGMTKRLLARARSGLSRLRLFLHCSRRPCRSIPFLMRQRNTLLFFISQQLPTRPMET